MEFLITLKSKDIVLMINQMCATFQIPCKALVILHTPLKLQRRYHSPFTKNNLSVECYLKSLTSKNRALL